MITRREYWTTMGACILCTILAFGIGEALTTLWASDYNAQYERMVGE